MRREDRVRKELRDGTLLEWAARDAAMAFFDEETSPATKAALLRELRVTLAALASAGNGQQGDDLDELADRRKKRRERFG